MHHSERDKEDSCAICSLSESNENLAQKAYCNEYNRFYKLKISLALHANEIRYACSKSLCKCDFKVFCRRKIIDVISEFKIGDYLQTLKVIFYSSCGRNIEN